MHKIEQQILGLLALNQAGLSARELRAQVHPKVSQPTLWRRIEKLRAMGRVLKVGRGRATRYVGSASSHALADLRSKALHIEVGRKLLRRPELVEQARCRLEKMRQTTPYSRNYVDRWAELLRGPLDGLLRMLGGDDEDSKALRHASPFAGFLGEQERIAVLRRQGLLR